MRWHQLLHAHIHGFAGLVFGILILAMVPLYVATTIVIARTNAPLFNFKLTIPGFIKNAFVQTPMDEPEPTPVSENADEQKTESEIDTEQPTNVSTPNAIPETVPAEMRVAYARARDNVSRIPTSAFDLSNVTRTVTSVTKTEQVTNLQPLIEESDIPIPTDFDIDDVSSVVDNSPIFTDLNFDDDDTDTETDNDVPQIDDIKTTTENNDAVIKHLDSLSVPYTTDGEVVITDKFAIVSHTDSDFWVADNESWFAAGKIRQSPIESVLSVATAHNVKPVLYLGADNIMDIDELRTQWETTGIRVITDLKDLI